MKPRGNFLNGFVAVVALLAAMGADVSIAAPKKPRLVESGIYVHINEEYEIFWMDDRTVFLNAYPQGKPRNDADIRNLIPSLFLWTLGEAPKPYAAGVWSWKYPLGGYCASDGEVHYSIELRTDESTGDKFIRRLGGRPGSETAWEERMKKPGEAFIGWNPSNRVGSVGGLPCRTFVDKSMTGRLWATDAAHEFYLDLGPRGPQSEKLDAPITLMRADRTHPITLPIRPSQITPQCTQYNRRTHSFLVWDCIIATLKQKWWKDSGCWPYWWIRLPQGGVERGCIPYGSWSEPVDELVPTRIGMHFVSLNFIDGRNTRDPGSAGLYRIDSGKAIRVLPGIIHKASVSPDGCKIAFNYAPHYHAKDIGTPGQTTVAVVDVCADSEGGR